MLFTDIGRAGLPTRQKRKIQMKCESWTEFQPLVIIPFWIDNKPFLVAFASLFIHGMWVRRSQPNLER